MKNNTQKIDELKLREDVNKTGCIIAIKKAISKIDDEHKKEVEEMKHPTFKTIINSRITVLEQQLQRANKKAEEIFDDLKELHTFKCSECHGNGCNDAFEHEIQFIKQLRQKHTEGK